MRVTALVLAACLMSATAAAQHHWKEYRAPDDSWWVEYPGEPTFAVTTYRTPDGRSVHARTYTLRQEHSEFRVLVAEVGKTEEEPLLAQAIKEMARDGEIRVNFPHRVGEVYGRQLSIAGADGSRTAGAVFYFNELLFSIEGRVDRGGNQSDVVFFTNSLIFDRDFVNRTEEQLAAYRKTCEGVVTNPPVSQPAGMDDPRCRRR